MTTRPGNAALGILQHRSKRLCNLVRVVRRDGVEVLFSDHDRALHFEGRVYAPAAMSGMTADSREIALKTSGQELHGVIEGTTMLVPDLMGQRYRGAEVWHIVTDWQYPWLVIGRHFKFVQSVRWDGHRFVASLVGITQILERPSGGRFGGVATIECPYVYGDADTCRKDITVAPEVVFGVKVEAVTDARLTFSVTAASFAGGVADDYYRDGEITWKWDPPVAVGNTTASATTLTQAPDPRWTVNEHVGRYVIIIAAPDGAMEDRAIITANTSNTLTYETLPNGAPPGATDYEISALSDNAETVSPIVRSADTARSFELFAPTPYDIEVGARGHLRAGCNGLFSTCKDKSNSDNFGGQHLQPRPADRLEVDLP